MSWSKCQSHSPEKKIVEYEVQLRWSGSRVAFATIKEQNIELFDWLYRNVGIPSYRGDTRPYRGWSVSRNDLRDEDGWPYSTISLFFINEEDAIMFKLKFGDTSLSGD